MVYTICYTDHDEDSLAAVKDYLETSGSFSAETATTAADGLGILNNRAVDAVICGRLPEMDGITFLQEVRSRHGDLPFIFFSENGQEEAILEALRCGADFCLQKRDDRRIRCTELLQTLRLAVGARRGDRAEIEHLHRAEECAGVGIREYDPAAGTVRESEIEACVPEWEGIHHELTGLDEQATDGTLEFSVTPADGSGPRVVRSVNQITRNPGGDQAQVMSIVHDDTESRSTERAFRSTIRNIVGSVGLESLDRITESVASWLEADCVMIGEIMPCNTRVRVLSMMLDGEHVRDFSYDLKGSPCENVTEKGYCIYPKNAVKLFPTAKDMVELNVQGYVGTAMRNSRGQVMGILCVLTRRPLRTPPALQEIIDLIAVKAVAEIERKRSDEAIQKARRMLADAMDLARLANWEYEVSESVFTVDGRFYSLYGATAGQEGATRMALETYLREFVHPEDRDMVATELNTAACATDPCYLALCNHRVVRRDGEHRHIAMRIGVTTDEQGRAMTLHGANQDITELKLAEQALLQANHKVNLLSSITRHDILNQIQIISGYLEIAHCKSGDAELDRIFAILKESTRNIQQQIEFTRVYQDLGTHEPQWQSLEAVLQNLPAPRRIDLSSDLNGIEVYADPILEKVFYNLMDNSLQHGGEVSAVHVSAVEEEGGALVVWEDDGRGIPTEEKTKIFTKGYGKNTGFGLFLICEILAITGITIRENGEPGKGARFEIAVPKQAYRRA
ncbi:hybrid sensor histidine kinase/response regulator [Methanofollis fontis]|uniref:hybrid sensor histidine kinase/response regulator n=1 Tax=Methanofollis fontis TaxID=2052832 RepID=UPI0013EE4DCC|nr:hybrid sensor histidine kinase/response regulator [Methanofollis fontis]